MKQKYQILILVIAMIFITGCDIANKRTEESTKNLENIETLISNDVEQKQIKVASFNIQVFGQSKIKKSEVMDILYRIIKKYDVVAIQEVGVHGTKRRIRALASCTHKY